MGLFTKIGGLLDTGCSKIATKVSNNETVALVIAETKVHTSTALASIAGLTVAASLKLDDQKSSDVIAAHKAKKVLKEAERAERIKQRAEKKMPAGPMFIKF